MKNIFFTLLFISNILAAEEYNYKILKVTDGDTVLIEAPYLPKPLKQQIGLRIFGVDTPEKSFLAKCQKEKLKGEQATIFTKSMVDNAKSTKIIITGKDKYFRLLGDVIIDNKSLKTLLLENDYARNYNGDKKSNWCN